MKFKLYFGPGACSFVPHALLEIAGADYEPTMVKLHKGEQNSDEYLSLNPSGQVPVLVVNSDTTEQVVITQIVAICNLINDLFPDHNFLPKDPIAKAKALGTFAWMNNTVHPTFTHIFMPQKFSDSQEVQAGLKPYNTALFAKQLADINAMVEGKSGEWLNGQTIGVLDCYALTLTRWGGIAGIDPTQFTALWAHINQVAAHPAVARVVERERLTLNVFKPS